MLLSKLIHCVPSSWLWDANFHVHPGPTPATNKLKGTLETSILMQYSPSWEAQRHSAGQIYLLWNMRDQHHLQNSMPHHTISLYDFFFILPRHLFLSLAWGLFHSGFQNITFLHILHLPMTHIFPWLNHSNSIWRRAQTMKEHHT